MAGKRLTGARLCAKCGIWGFWKKTGRTHYGDNSELYYVLVCPNPGCGDTRTVEQNEIAQEDLQYPDFQVVFVPLHKLPLAWITTNNDGETVVLNADQWYNLHDGGMECPECHDTTTQKMVVGANPSIEMIEIATWQCGKCWGMWMETYRTQKIGNVSSLEKPKHLGKDSHGYYQIHFWSDYFKKWSVPNTDAEYFSNFWKSYNPIMVKALNKPNLMGKWVETGFDNLIDAQEALNKARELDREMGRYIEYRIAEVNISVEGIEEIDC